MSEKFTQFDYLLNAMLDAGRHKNPAEHGYGDKRRKLYEHVRELERKAAEAETLRALWAEWELGEYDGKDLLRRVRLALHGPLRKPIAHDEPQSKP